MVKSSTRAISRVVLNHHGRAVLLDRGTRAWSYGPCYGDEVGDEAEYFTRMKPNASQ